MRLNGGSELDVMDGVLKTGILRITPEDDLGDICVLLMYSILKVELMLVSRFLLVSLDIDAILAEAVIHKMSTPIVLINPIDRRSRGLREVPREW